MHKKAWCTCKVAVLQIKTSRFLTFALPLSTWLLKLTDVKLKKRMVSCAVQVWQFTQSKFEEVGFPTWVFSDKQDRGFQWLLCVHRTVPSEACACVYIEPSALSCPQKTTEQKWFNIRLEKTMMRFIFKFPWRLFCEKPSTPLKIAP